MLFGREFMPEGAGISPDTPRKKGLVRLFEILSRDLDGIFLSGLLALLACVPAAVLIGLALWLGSLPLCLLAAVAAGWLVGPALTCLYDTILRALRDEPGYTGGTPINESGSKASAAVWSPASCLPYFGHCLHGRRSCCRR